MNDQEFEELARNRPYDALMAMHERLQAVEATLAEVVEVTLAAPEEPAPAP
jgi:hypothetical protein